jgi:hypothetical protein
MALGLTFSMHVAAIDMPPRSSLVMRPLRMLKASPDQKFFLRIMSPRGVKAPANCHHRPTDQGR